MGQFPEIGPEIDPEIDPENGPENGPEIDPEIDPENDPENGPEIGPENGPEIDPEINPENPAVASPLNLEHLAAIGLRLLSLTALSVHRGVLGAVVQRAANGGETNESAARGAVEHVLGFGNRH